MPAQLVSHYRILSPLGSGGMGVVYRAEDTTLLRTVALKFLSQQATNSPRSTERLQHEARAASALNHPNICTIYEVGEDAGETFIAMEYVEGRALAELIRQGPLPTETVFRYGRQLASALAHAHERGVIHGDLKPLNVIVSSLGDAKILDFGLARRKDPAEFDRQTLETVSSDNRVGLAGTLPYMAPEQIQGNNASPRTDLWSLGIVLYEMATGIRPFHGENLYLLCNSILHDTPRPITSQVSPGLTTIIFRCLEKEPARRYQRASEARAALEALTPSTDDLARDLKERREQFSLIGLVHLPRWALATLLAFAGLLAAGAMWIIAPRLPERLRMRPPLVQTLEARQLAVLPFTNVGNDPANQAFCDGLVQILSSKLSQVEQFQKTLRVVPATDVLREGIVSVKEARQTFGVSLVITGSIQRTGNRVRMTINLVDPQALRQLKSKTIDTEIRDISTLQDGVVLEAAELLDVRLTSEARQVLAVGGTTVPDAYDLYAQGIGFLQRYDVAPNVDHAISLFKAALERDNGYALAQAGLGEAYWRKYEQTKDPQWAEQAEKSSAAALRLNDKLAQVYVTIGMIHTGTGDYDQAIESLRRALRLDPINADAYRELAKAYERLGKLNEAEATYRNAIVVRPNYWVAHNELGSFYFRLGRYAEAEKEFQTVVELTPDNARGYSYLGVAALAQKRYEEAEKMFEKSVAIKPTDTAYNYLGVLYFTLARYPDAARYFELAVQMNGHDSDRWHSLAAAYQWSNQPDKARAAFQRTAELAEMQLRTNPRDTYVLIMLADAYSMTNQPQRARELLEKALALAPSDINDMFQASVVYEQLGDRKLALEYIAKAIRGGYPRDVIEKAPSLAQLRRDPKFQGLSGQ